MWESREKKNLHRYCIIAVLLRALPVSQQGQGIPKIRGVSNTEPHLIQSVTNLLQAWRLTPFPRRKQSQANTAQINPGKGHYWSRFVSPCKYTANSAELLSVFTTCSTALGTVCLKTSGQTTEFCSVLLGWNHGEDRRHLTQSDFV